MSSPVVLSEDQEDPWGKIVIIKKDGSDSDNALELFDEVDEADPYLFGR